MNTLKSRLSAKVGDESNSHLQSGDNKRTRNVFLKLLNASYAIVSQHQDDAYCNDNLYMLPRVYSENTNAVSGLWSPVSLKPTEKSFDELDNVVEKFMRCISVESYSNDTNVL